ncbi:hypothetical protein LTR84_003893 [Exophiala bonariae]|uniref:mRNA-capping enzyme subunit alpha n=1 Tax=Exophiala bonariae TaxID=1690606 RepID=A0AAV9NB26_9EURO|nr:hypothetical protein LTR84_003893 [Exophiala bonariae]
MNHHREPAYDPQSLIARVGGIWAGAELQHTFQNEVAALLGRSNRSFPGAQPVSFAGKHLQELKKQDYYVCEKTDGLRYLMYLTEDKGHGIHYLIDRKNDYYYVPNLYFPHHDDKAPNKFHTGTILDGELVEDKFPDRDSVTKYLVFDCLVLDNNTLLQRPLDKRLGYFKAHVLEPYNAYFKSLPDPHKRPFVVEDKSTEFSYGLEKMFKEIIPRVKQLHGNDGLIFTCKNTPYKSGTDEHILKWKPPSENTVDFLMHIDWPLYVPDPDDPDQSRQPDYHAFPSQFGLYINHGNDKYAYIDDMFVTPEEWEEWKSLNRPLQDSIVECFQEDVLRDKSPLNGTTTNGDAAYSSGNTRRWRFHRFRDDKTDANHISTYESVIQSIHDHVTEEDLLANAEGIRSAWKIRDAAARQKRSVGAKQ